MPGGVGDHQATLGVQRFGPTFAWLGTKQIVPIEKAPGVRWAWHARAAAGHDHVVNRWASAGGLRGNLLHGDRFAPPLTGIDRDQDLGAGIREPGGDGCRAESGEDRDRDRADLGACQEGDDGLRDHRQEQSDRVALADSDAL